MLIRVLLVDDDSVMRSVVSSVLGVSGFHVTTASNVSEALSLICSDRFDVLLSDLNMPGAGDGLTVVSAMRHANPEAVTLLFSAFPQMAAASQALVLQADEILTKPMDMSALIGVIRQRVAVGPVRGREVLGVDEILAREIHATVHTWVGYCNANASIAAIPITYEERIAHLQPLIRELIARLRSAPGIGGKQRVSLVATKHGILRQQQGYRAVMLVEESRMLQLSIFQTLQTNLVNVDFRVLLNSVMVIADEIDSQLAQTMASFLGDTASPPFPPQPVAANAPSDIPVPCPG